MNRFILTFTSVIIGGIFAIDIYRAYKNKEYIDRINKLENNFDDLKKEFESVIVSKQNLPEKVDIIHVPPRESEPSPYGWLDEKYNEEYDEGNGEGNGNDDRKICNSASVNSIDSINSNKSNNSVEELVANSIPDKEDKDNNRGVIEITD